MVTNVFAFSSEPLSQFAKGEIVAEEKSGGYEMGQTSSFYRLYHKLNEPEHCLGEKTTRHSSRAMFFSFVKIRDDITYGLTNSLNFILRSPNTISQIFESLSFIVFLNGVHHLFWLAYVEQNNKFTFTIENKIAEVTSK